VTKKRSISAFLLRGLATQKKKTTFGHKRINTMGYFSNLKERITQGLLFSFQYILVPGTVLAGYFIYKPKLLDLLVFRQEMQ
jgi:hypothetical protein